MGVRGIYMCFLSRDVMSRSLFFVKITVENTDDLNLTSKYEGFIFFFYLPH